MTTPIRIPRSSVRFPVWINASCRISLGRASDIIISNLSLEGCGITIGEDLVRTGQQVLVKLSSLEPLAGRVCWVKGKQAGIRFDRPLYGPVLEHLVRVQLNAPPQQTARRTEPLRKI